MKKNKPSIKVLVAALIAMTALSAGVSTSAASPYSGFSGMYHQVNNDFEAYIMSVTLNDDGFYVVNGGFYDVDYGYSGSPGEIEKIPDGIAFDCLLSPLTGLEGSSNVPTRVTLRQVPSGLYEINLDFNGPTDRNLAEIEGSTTLYKGNDYKIDGSVPAKIGDKVTIAGLIKAISPYIFAPEMMTARMFLRDPASLSDEEIIRHDERNRFFDYGWGAEDQYMECKYWNTSDGNVLLVINFHDGTYQYPQRMRFFKFNKKDGTVRELRTALADKWPFIEGGDPHGIVYQVRYESDGIVALVPETHGDSYDIVTLKFDGEKFR